ncbi:MAG: HAD-IIB family hydrolase [Frankia sp.]|nr:HAD-IIB family hydrolase [Frankia sp.]
MAAFPRLVAFDLDETLAPLKEPAPVATTSRLAWLLTLVDVCVLSGAAFEQFEWQLLRPLAAQEGLLGRLHLMPTCGTRYYRRRDGEWSLVHADELTEPERARVRAVLATSARELGLWEPVSYGERIEDRGTQVTFSALGQQAPYASKKAWDPDGRRRAALVERVRAALPGFEVRANGYTSVDVTRAGADKGQAIRRLISLLGLTRDEVLFIGDRLDPAGIDYPVYLAGVTCLPVTSWEQTVAVMDGLLDWHRDPACCPLAARFVRLAV